jgi:hypothetical protein
MVAILFKQLLHMHNVLLGGWILMLLLPVDNVFGWISPVNNYVGSMTNSARRRLVRNRCDDTALFEHQNGVGEWDRREFIQTTMALTSVAAAGTAPALLMAHTAVAATGPPPSTLPPARLLDVGGGIDISIDTKSKILSDPSNLVFPASLTGRWSCIRTCLSVDGDAYQAQSAWRAMVGGRNNNVQFGPTAVPEQYDIQFIPSPFQPEKYTVWDRYYELRSRSSSGNGSGMIIDPKSTPVPVQWNAQEPNIVRVGNTEVAVIQRSVIVPNLEQGVVAGGQELLRISSSGDPIVRAVVVKQRFRPAVADAAAATQVGLPNGDISVVEGLELVQTFRVLDGVAGTEFPTSTTKYLLELVKLGPVVNTSTEDDATATLVSSSSMYFDGTTWY